MLLLFDVFLLAVDETIEHRPFLGNTEIVLNISDCYVIALGRDAKEDARWNMAFAGMSFEKNNYKLYVP